MKKIYRQQLYHEVLHSISAQLDEQSIADIVDFCENPNLGKKLNPLRTDAQTIGATADTSRGQKDKANIEAAQSKVTNIPQSLAEGSVSIPSPEPQTSGIAALNNSFIQTSRSPASASVTIPLQQSITMSAPFFKAAAKVFGNYKIIPTTASSVRANPSGFIAEKDSPSTAAAAANAEKPTADERGRSGVSNGDVATSASVSRNVASSAEGSGKVSTSSSSPSLKSKANDDTAITSERNNLAQKLVSMSIPQARDYITKNQSQLERLKILVLSQKNQKFGFQDPAGAAVLIQEVNGQLRIESQ